MVREEVLLLRFLAGVALLAGLRFVFLANLPEYDFTRGILGVAFGVTHVTLLSLRAPRNDFTLGLVNTS